MIGVNSATVAKEMSDAIGFNVQNVNFSIRIDAVRSFLTKEGIAFDMTDEESPELSTAEIAEALQPSTVQLLCYGTEDTESPPNRQRNVQEPLWAGQGQCVMRSATMPSALTWPRSRT